jgi:hypothetical protein
VACTRVLRRAPLQLIGSRPVVAFGDETYELNLTAVEVEVKLRPMVSRPVCLGVWLAAGAHDQSFFFLSDNGGFLEVGRPL